MDFLSKVLRRGFFPGIFIPINILPSHNQILGYERADKKSREIITLSVALIFTCNFILHNAK